MKLISKIASLSVGLALAVGVGVAFGSKEAKVVRATDATMTPGTNGSACTVNEHDGIKVGTSSKGGNLSIAVGSGATSLSFYAVGWKSKSVTISLTISVGTLGTSSFDLNNDDGATSNSPFTLNGNEEDFLCTTALSDVSSDATVTLTSASLRFIAWGASYETGGTPDVLQSIAVTGSMSKTEYTTAESWSADGLVATGTYTVSGQKDITSKVAWTFSPSTPTVGVTSVVATASLSGKSGNSTAQAVTVEEAPADPGTEENPYTVAQARAAIDAGSGTSNVYATGIVSKIVTAYDSGFKNVTFNISADGLTTSVQLQAFREKSSYSSTVKVGDIVVVRGNLTKYGSTYEFAANCAITSLEEPSGTKYSVIDRVDYGSLDKDEVIEGSTLAAKIVPETGYWYPESVIVLMGGSPATYSYVNGVVTIENVTGNVSIEGTCSSCNPIKSLYAKLVGSPVEIDGYFVGAVNDGIFLMDGEYGIFVYQGLLPAGAIVNETKLHVSGTIGVFGNTLYQIAAGATITINASAEVATPINYTLTGSESTSDLSIASRRLLEKGAISAITRDGTTYEPSYTGDVPTVDTSKDVFLTINGIQVIYKKSDVTQAVFNVLFEYLLNGKNVFVEAFTSFYNENFQLRFSSVVEATEGYTAEKFASDLLEKTDVVCEDYDGVTDNKAALAAVWLELQEKVLSDEEIDRFNDNENDFSSARARYDYLVGKYGLTDFLQRNPAPIPGGAYTSLSIEGNPTIFIVVAIATASTLAFTLLLVFKKKKHN